MCRGNGREIEQVERELNVIARIEAEFALSYLLCYALMTFHSTFWLFICGARVGWWEEGSCEIARQGKVKLKILSEIHALFKCEMDQDGRKRWKVKLIGHFWWRHCGEVAGSWLDKISLEIHEAQEDRLKWWVDFISQSSQLVTLPRRSTWGATQSKPASD